MLSGWTSSVALGPVALDPVEEKQPMSSQPTAPASEGDIEYVLAGLDDLDDVPVAEHVARFHALHESLTAALAGIDEV